ncbi:MULTISPECIES: N-6 DNA methylase [Ligilactobacillus]|uniref:N-6 DNA methylase n=1 Tax=Ligilactobacillus TaxID=2767887 RepID=UPI00096FBC08|nr:N-6 DNA methylase [Ligilactobacillus murinus]TGY51282.1 N-6 DNA methylase [Ligilactobacillus murinus]
MELKELTEKTLALFDSKNTAELIKKLPNYWNDNDTKAEFKKLVGDLSVDWLQKIFQYYEADRKDKKQDYTPTTLAKLMAGLALRGDEKYITDMCAGSGALTIQCWNLNHNIEAECLEFDEKVIPILLFNMAVRNINATVYQMDVLQQEITNSWRVVAEDEFGRVIENGNNN